MRRTVAVNSYCVFPPDINQIERLGQQLGKQKFLSLCYKDATSTPFGFLMIDLSPKTLDLLRFCIKFGANSFLYTQ